MLDVLTSVSNYDWSFFLSPIGSSQCHCSGCRSELWLCQQQRNTSFRCGGWGLCKVGWWQSAWWEHKQIQYLLWIHHLSWLRSRKSCKKYLREPFPCQTLAEHCSSIPSPARLTVLLHITFTQWWPAGHILTPFLLEMARMPNNADDWPSKGEVKENISLHHRWPKIRTCFFWSAKPIYICWLSAFHLGDHE